MDNPKNKILRESGLLRNHVEHGVLQPSVHKTRVLLDYQFARRTNFEVSSGRKNSISKTSANAYWKKFRFDPGQLRGSN